MLDFNAAMVTKAAALGLGRLLLAVHFLTELADKIMHFQYWVQTCKDVGFPLGWPAMSLVVALLAYGCPALLLGSPAHVRRGVGCLLLFQVPTTIFFENEAYERFDSVSVCGGLLLAAVLFGEDDDEAKGGEAQAQAVQVGMGARLLPESA